MDEIWKDIKGYEGLYQVSNLGRVKSLGWIDRLGRRRPGVILIPGMTKDGYPEVGLHKEGKQKMFLVHRLVAQTFIPNPEGLKEINHKDEDKTNNVVFLKDDWSVDEFRSNLEWCDGKYNCNYGTRNERQVRTRIMNGNVDLEMCGIKDKKEYQRLWYQKNREKRLEYLREYRQNNREKIREQNKDWYQKNRERRLEYHREYRQKNMEKVLEYHREYYRNHKKGKTDD